MSDKQLWECEYCDAEYDTEAECDFHQVNACVKRRRQDLIFQCIFWLTIFMGLLLLIRSIL